MSRIAKQPIDLPSGVEVTFADNSISVKGPKGNLQLVIHNKISVIEASSKADDTKKQIQIAVKDDSQEARALSGTHRALINNMVVGVTSGFEKELTLIGVGYRAKAQGSKVDLSLGFSHPVVYDLPKEVQAETPNNTTIILKSIDKQILGQVAAEIRSKRPPEPYKGKGIRYKGEYVARKEAKKK